MKIFNFFKRLIKPQMHGVYSVTIEFKTNNEERLLSHTFVDIIQYNEKILVDVVERNSTAKFLLNYLDVGLLEADHIDGKITNIIQDKDLIDVEENTDNRIVLNIINKSYKLKLIAI